ncbi:MAG: YciC family protein [Pseudomonadota bacterium]
MKAGHGRTKLDVRLVDIARRYGDLGVHHWQTLLVLMLFSWVAFTLVGYVQDTVLAWRPEDLLTFFDLDVVPVAFVTAACAHAVLWGVPGAGPAASMGVARRAFVSVLAVTLLVRIAVVFGLIALVIPGLAMIVFLGLAAVIMVAERPGVFASLRQSFEMVLSAFVKVIGAYIVFVLSFVGIVFVMIIVVALATVNLGDPLSGHITDGALSAALSISHTVFAVAVYQVLTEARTAEPTVH